MNKFETGISRYLKEHEAENIRGAVIGIAGAGGLGSNCAVNLVRSGFKNFVLADHDVVEPSNLNRQFFFESCLGKHKVKALEKNLKKINPDIAVTSHIKKLKSDTLGDIFKGCHCVIEALDEPRAKKMFVEHFLHSEKLIVAASGIGGTGNTDRIRIHRLGKRFFIVGDLVSEVTEGCPPFAPGVTIAAAKQADIVLSHYIHKQR